MYKSAEKPYLKRAKGMKAVPQQAAPSVLQRTATAQRSEGGAPDKTEIKSETRIPLHHLYTNISLYKTRSYFHWHFTFWHQSKISSEHKYTEEAGQCLELQQ